MPKRVLVTLDDETAAAAEVIAGEQGVSGWVAAVIREKLLSEACRRAGEYDAAHDDEQWERDRLAGAA